MHTKVLEEDEKVPDYLRKWADKYPGKRFCYAYDRTPRVSAALKQQHQEALDELNTLSKRTSYGHSDENTLPAELPACKCLTVLQYSKSKLAEFEDDLLSTLKAA